MDNHDGEHQSLELDLQSPSPDRPPQLNQTVCGCRCGRGSSRGNGTDDDDGRNEDETATLVASEASESGEEVSSVAAVILDNFIRSALVHEMQSGLDGRDMNFDSPGTTVYSTPGNSRRASSYGETVESLENQPGSGKLACEVGNGEC